MKKSSVLMIHDQDQESNNEVLIDKYLVFSLKNELYGSLLTDVKEVIKLTESKPVPFMPPYIKGVINLRGQVITIVDLRIKFGITISPHEKSLILIVESENSSAGLIVDDIKSVVEISKDKIENPKIQTKLPLKLMDGIAMAGGSLINIINLKGCIENIE